MKRLILRLGVLGALVVVGGAHAAPVTTDTLQQANIVLQGSGVEIQPVLTTQTLQPAITTTNLQ